MYVPPSILSALVNDPELFAKGISLHYVNIGGLHQTQSNDLKLALAQLGRCVPPSARLTALPRTNVAVDGQGWTPFYF